MTYAPRSAPLLLSLVAALVPVTLPACSAPPPPRASVPLTDLVPRFAHAASVDRAETAPGVLPRVAPVRRGAVTRLAVILGPGDVVLYDITVPAAGRLELYAALLAGRTARVAFGPEGLAARRRLRDDAGWQPLEFDLARRAGQRVTILLGLEEAEPGTRVAFGAPIVRGAYPSGGSSSVARRRLGEPPPPAAITLLLRACGTRAPRSVDGIGEAVVFEDAITAATRPRRSLAALLTDRWAVNGEATANGTGEAPLSTAGERPRAGFVGILRRAGYRTAGVDPAGWLAMHAADFDASFGATDLAAAAAAAKEWQAESKRPALLVVVDPRPCGSDESAPISLPAPKGGIIAWAGLAPAGWEADGGLEGRDLRVALGLLWPGVFAARSVATAVSVVDLAPTLLELAAANQKRTAGAGQSLLPLIAAPTRPSAFGWRRRPILVAAPGGGADAGGELHEVGLLLDGWFLVRGGGKGPRLYDHARDPSARSDVSGRHADLVGRLATEMERAVRNPVRR